MDYLSLCKNRYSCRMLQDRPVEQEKIDRIIEAGLCAPTAVNKQPFRIFVIQSPEALEKAAVSYPFDFVRKAPVLLVIGAQENETRYTLKNVERRAFLAHRLSKSVITWGKCNHLGCPGTFEDYFDSKINAPILP